MKTISQKGVEARKANKLTQKDLVDIPNAR
jgi:ribosome-associated protein YbcJ (S4-like RNA binding protein)